MRAVVNNAQHSTRRDAPRGNYSANHCYRTLAPAGVVLFVVLATMNSAGYRYGASDQAFYIPAILGHLEPESFPRDRALVESQSKLMVFDEGMALAARLTGWSLPSIFLIGYLAGLTLLLAGSWR